MKKHLCSLLLFMGFSLSLTAQQAYFVNDSTKKTDVLILDGGDFQNARTCQVQNGKWVKHYTPNLIREYGLADGRVYSSREIIINGKKEKVFLERLVNGKLTLYKFNDPSNPAYYLEIDSSLFTELPKKEGDNSDPAYREKLAGIISDCSFLLKESKKVKYTDNSLIRIVEMYDYCGLKALPEWKFGAVLGLAYSRPFYESPLKIYDPLKTPTDLKDIPLNQIDYFYKSGLAFGVSLDKTFWNSNFSFHSELYYSQVNYSYSKISPLLTLDFEAKTSSVNVPLLVRYTFPLEKFRPYINTGFSYVYNIRNGNSFLFEQRNSGNEVLKRVTTYDHISKNMVGLSIGSGVEYKLVNQKSLIFELRLNKIFGSTDVNSLGKSEIQLLTGISF